MARSIYITSAEGHTGKSTVALGVLESLRHSVGRVGVFRPIARSTDERDYVLANLGELPARGFYVACFPVKIKGASAGWCRAVAIFGLEVAA